MVKITAQQKIVLEIEVDESPEDFISIICEDMEDAINETSHNGRTVAFCKALREALAESRSRLK